MSSIFYNDVSFSYDKQRPVLRNISLNIQRGEIVGIMGKNGAGRTRRKRQNHNTKKPTQKHQTPEIHNNTSRRPHQTHPHPTRPIQNTTRSPKHPHTLQTTQRTSNKTIRRGSKTCHSLKPTSYSPT